MAVTITPRALLHFLDMPYQSSRADAKSLNFDLRSFSDLSTAETLKLRETRRQLFTDIFAVHYPVDHIKVAADGTIRPTSEIDGNRDSIAEHLVTKILLEELLQAIWQSTVYLRELTVLSLWQLPSTSVETLNVRRVHTYLPALQQLMVRVLPQWENAVQIQNGNELFHHRLEDPPSGVLTAIFRILENTQVENLAFAWASATSGHPDLILSAPFAIHDRRGTDVLRLGRIQRLVLNNCWIDGQHLRTFLQQSQLRYIKFERVSVADGAWSRLLGNSNNQGRLVQCVFENCGYATLTGSGYVWDHEVPRFSGVSTGLSGPRYLQWGRTAQPDDQGTWRVMEDLDRMRQFNMEPCEIFGHSHPGHLQLRFCGRLARRF